MQLKGNASQLQKISNRKQLWNSKNNRRRCLVKKAIELAERCDVDVLVVVRDQKCLKYTIYESGSPGDQFTLEEASEHLKQAQRAEDANWQIMRFANQNYGGGGPQDENDAPAHAAHDLESFAHPDELIEQQESTEDDITTYESSRKKQWLACDFNLEK